MTNEQTDLGTVNQSDICPTGQMSDRALVNHIGKRFTGFLLEMRPYLVEVHQRFVAKTSAGKPFLGHTNWDVFCLDFWTLRFSSVGIDRYLKGKAK